MEEDMQDQGKASGNMRIARVSEGKRNEGSAGWRINRVLSFRGAGHFSLSGDLAAPRLWANQPPLRLPPETL